MMVGNETVVDGNHPSTTPGEVPVDPAQHDVHPWPRFFARSFDLSFFTLALFLVLVVIGAYLAPEATVKGMDYLEVGLGRKILIGMLSVAIALPFVALLVTYGQTPGKWLFGVHVRNLDGTRLGLGKAFHRELLVAVKGLGLGISLVQLFTMLVALSRLSQRGATSWDHDLHCKIIHAPRTTVWWMKATLGVTAMVALGVFSIL